MTSINLRDETISKIFFDVSSEVAQITEPLNKVGINYFTYFKNFNDGTKISVSNDRLWLEDYYKFKLYNSSLFENHPSNYKTGFFLWSSTTNDLQVVNHGKDYFNSDNGITLIEKQQDFCEFFFFSGKIEDLWLTNFYINNLDLLKKFTYYFKSVFNTTLKNLEKTKIIIPRDEPLNKKHFNNIFGVNLINNYLSDLKKIIEPDILFKISEDLSTSEKLSTREIDIIKQLILGKSAKETGIALKISYRTVEKHLENIKQKFNCNNKTAIISKILGS